MEQSIQNKNRQICNRAYITRTSRYAIEHTKQKQADIQQSIQNKNKQICNRAYTKREQADMEQNIQNKNNQIFNRAYKTKISRYAIEHT